MIVPGTNGGSVAKTSIGNAWKNVPVEGTPGCAMIKVFEKHRRNVDTVSGTNRLC